MIEPCRALVRPRITADDGGSQLLEDEITNRLAAGEFGLVALTGARYSGKLTALAHLAAVFADDPRVVIVERLADFSYDEGQQGAAAAPELLVVYLAAESALLNSICRPLRLAAWGEDEWIEYLLAAHRERCPSVMARLRRDRARSILGPCTLLHRLVLDALAGDDSLVDTMAALRIESLRRLGDDLPGVARRMFDELTEVQVDARRRPVQIKSRELAALLQLPNVMRLLAVEYIVDRLRRAFTVKVLRRPLSRAIVEAVAARLQEEPPLLERIRSAANRNHGLEQPMGASLIHAAGDTWRPVDDSCLNLKCAHLSGMRWPGIRLKNLYIEHADLTGADLTGADLTGADLTGADMSESQLTGVLALSAILQDADLHGAKLVNFYARKADFRGADLGDVRGETCVFEKAVMAQANLQGATLGEADFDGADLRGASLRRADLKSAGFRDAQIEEADFTGADLSFADMRELDLRCAEFAGASFWGTRLEKADLSGMRLPGAQFAGAFLTEADLTASDMPYANFAGADLRLAGLAEVEWENVNLQNADLSGATFHMGSSRSGLCATPPASEGTRTGFYTDDYEEQGFKSPEEIRKANLCGADLRGAKFDDVDFYLVDVRGALYSAEQELHLRRSGAILESRV